MKIGAIFDWDGVIVDSSAHHEKSWEMLAEEEGRVLPSDHFTRGFGRKNQFIIPNILKWSDEPEVIERLGSRKETLYRELLGKGPLEPLPGVRALLEELKACGVPMAVGSSTPRINLDTTIGLLGLDGFFEHLVAAEDVGKGKPDPEVFVKAAQCIDRPRAQCIVFEDAIYGIEAALAGGIKVIAVATTHPLEDLGKASWAVKSLEAVTLRHMQDLLAVG